MTTRQLRKWRRLAERGRRLASQRDDLIAAGIDPAELAIPLHPMPPAEYQGATDLGEGLRLADLTRVWALVAVACLGAVAGCLVAVGTALTVSGDVTWPVWLCVVIGVLWAGGAILSGAHALELHRRSATYFTTRTTPDSEEPARG